MRNSQRNNRQLLSIAARDDELRAPMRTTQTYDINSPDRPVDATDHQRNCLVAATATAAAATGSMMTGPGQSFVGGLHPLTPARSSDGGDAVCIRATGPCCVVSIGSPVSLAVERKPSKYDRKKKLIISLTNRFVRKWFKMC